jgi:RNA-directed DNA polymerase
VQREQQNPEQIKLALNMANLGETTVDHIKVVEPCTETDQSEHLAAKEDLMELIFDEINIGKAIQRVMKNKGSPGIDEMTTEQLPNYMQKNWSIIKEEILSGKYKPKAVKLVEIPKPNGGIRKLGIPTVMDRTIQQAINQILQLIWEPKFSDNSYGFRPKRSAHHAVSKAQEYIRDERYWTVDIDLKDFFNEVNHDKLLSKMVKTIVDKRVLRLIRKYLQSGIMISGLTSMQVKGTPQGSPLSPLLSNIVLDDLDKELESRNHKFCRYADDFIILVKSERAAGRVMETVKSYITKRLKLRINEDKSKIVKANKVSFLGFMFHGLKDPRRRISKATLKKFKTQIKNYTRRHIGKSLERVITDLNVYLRGWLGYFGHCQTPSVLEQQNAWIRRRLRCIQWSQWKRGKTRYRELRKLGVDETEAAKAACNKRGAWQRSISLGIHLGLPNERLKSLGLMELRPRSC